jgi:hypothetical protein
MVLVMSVRGLKISPILLLQTLWLLPRLLRWGGFQAESKLIDGLNVADRYANDD